MKTKEKVDMLLDEITLWWETQEKAEVCGVSLPLYLQDLLMLSDNLGWEALPMAEDCAGSHQQIGHMQVCGRGWLSQLYLTLEESWQLRGPQWLEMLCLPSGGWEGELQTVKRCLGPWGPYGACLCGSCFRGQEGGQGIQHGIVRAKMSPPNLLEMQEPTVFPVGSYVETWVLKGRDGGKAKSVLK